MNAAQKRAGLKVTGNKHMLRHTFCSHLAMRGATVIALDINQIVKFGFARERPFVHYLPRVPNAVRELTELGLVDGRQVQVKTRLMQRRGDTSVGRDAAAIGTCSDPRTAPRHPKR